MDVSLWNIKNKKWNEKTNIKKIYISTSGTHFKLNGRTYLTKNWEINFIFSENAFTKKV